MPEPGSRPIRRNDAETLLIGGQQQIADGGRDPDHDKGDQPAQIDISTGWIPVEGEERADAANGKRCNHAERQGEANGDDPKAIVDGLHRERVDVARVRLVIFLNSHSAPKPNASKIASLTSAKVSPRSRWTAVKRAAACANWFGTSG